jgi:hypothetical protein
MQRLYGSINGIDLDHEYEVVRQNVRHAEEARELQGIAPWKELITGTNG